MSGPLELLTREFLDHKIADLVKMTNKEDQPNINSLWMMLKDLNAIKFSLKQQGYGISRSVFEAIEKTPIPLEPIAIVELPWKASTQSDVESGWFRYWCDQLKCAPIPHRKLWEYAFILQTLHSAGKLKPGMSAIGFGCGKEPLPSYFAKLGVAVTVTDLEPDKVKGMGWAETGQHTDSLLSCYKPDLVDEQKFLEMCTLKYVDMNAIPDDLNGKYDFCWSVCALEHLGSIKKGLDFIVNSVKCLKPGGVAIHTTEYNYASEAETVDNWPTVLFLRRHFQELRNELTREGYDIGEVDFSVGDGPLDGFVDLPPYDFDSFLTYRPIGEDPNASKYRAGHLKLSIDGFPATCFGVIVRRPN